MSTSVHLNQSAIDAVRELHLLAGQEGCEVVLWTGGKGRGKTTLARTSAEMLYSADSGSVRCRYARVPRHLPQKRRAGALLKRLLIDSIGHVPRTGLPMDELVADTMSRLRVGVLFLDDAHHLGKVGLKMIESLVESCDSSRFRDVAALRAIVLVGDPSLRPEVRLVPQLARRVRRVVEVNSDDGSVE